MGCPQLETALLLRELGVDFDLDVVGDGAAGGHAPLGLVDRADGLEADLRFAGGGVGLEADIGDVYTGRPAPEPRPCACSLH